MDILDWQRGIHVGFVMLPLIPGNDSLVGNFRERSPCLRIRDYCLTLFFY